MAAGVCRAAAAATRGIVPTPGQYRTRAIGWLVFACHSDQKSGKKNQAPPAHRARYSLGLRLEDNFIERLKWAES